MAVKRPSDLPENRCFAGGGVRSPPGGPSEEGMRTTTPTPCPECCQREQLTTQSSPKNSPRRPEMAAAAASPPVRFHRIHGANIRLDPSRTRATRVESFANGLCFSHEPLAPGQLFLVEIEEKEPGWCGHLRIGLTSQDPDRLEVVPEYSLPDLVDMGGSWVFAITRNHNRVLPSGEEGRATLHGFLSSPYLLIEEIRIPRDKLVGQSRPGRYSHLLDDLYKANVIPATARRSRIGVLYASLPDGTADMHIVINGEDMGPSARGLPSSRPLYAVVDVFASTKRVQVIPVDYGFPALQTLCRLTIQKHVVHRMAIDGLRLPPLLKDFCKYE